MLGGMQVLQEIRKSLDTLLRKQLKNVQESCMVECSTKEHLWTVWNFYAVSEMAGRPLARDV